MGLKFLLFVNRKECDVYGFIICFENVYRLKDLDEALIL
jgi:hypothetical protein